ncbi:helix-turn-helix transcriptional regulator [Hydrogenophaga defluvii]|uniref:Helix-turn-helix transcriptional regulator n=1 Tax=Hydrogenophaga defluvii TaxID=249410 RepID=A0ABW2SI20_9BURK
MPDDAIIRIARLLITEKNPSGLIDASPSHWYSGVAKGVHPSPIRLSQNVSGWRAGDIREWLAAQVEVSDSRARFKAPSRKVLARLQGAAAGQGYALTQVRNMDTAQVLLLLSKGDATRMFNAPAEVEAFLAKLEGGVTA